MKKTLTIRLEALDALRKYLAQETEELELQIVATARSNRWFTVDAVRERVRSIQTSYLDTLSVRNWIEPYDLNGIESSKIVGVVAAGNIPLVGIHDCLAVFLAGHDLMLKTASKDNVLLPFLLNKLATYAPDFEVQIVERLENYDAVIATGNNNSARYFEYYFRNVPNVIRKNRNGVAILRGNENKEELEALGNDIFNYFGLGCRSVSKLYLPEGYDLGKLIHVFDAHKDIMNHNLYRNNLDYNRTLLLMNLVPFLDVDYINITENDAIASPIANLHYEYYADLKSLKTTLDRSTEAIQCVVGQIEGMADVSFGQAQHPGLADYADKVDTLAFLKSI